MKVPGSINNIRRKIMRSITKNVGKSYKIPNVDASKPLPIKKVLIIRPNHRLGNQLLLTPIVQEVINTFPNCSIDLFVKGGVAVPVFQNYEAVNKIIQLPKKPFNHLIKYMTVWVSVKQKKYDLVINGDTNSSSGKLLTNISRAKFKVFGEHYEDIASKFPDYRHISKKPIYNLRRFLENLGYSKNESELPVLNINLDKTEIENGNRILSDIIKNNKKTICIYTNATGDKCYSETWWSTFYDRLLKEYPNYNIIEMLPIENISKINFKAPHFYSKDIREMAAIIKNTSVFIAADNGVMHLASASLTPTVGFFAPTDLTVYGPYGNQNIAINTNESTINEWIKAINSILN
ncbi:ADP-heptose--LPS heptosyltransferase [Tamlana sedimentorum]|uniref:ADP-heptose--LPS heptosyltransferase n=1 Tax=Neotamlana sedimentorum TaxID=1435349 RepID=A0A0D7WAD6_9FLAO|nr:glycosyltransferase family 9 protein [Tamlana sedimentorum]KJD36101.1 ADP-heptose--LPS heptosyltransferase [Tamlana sedimentorum]